MVRHGDPAGRCCFCSRTHAAAFRSLDDARAFRVRLPGFPCRPLHELLPDGLRHPRPCGLTSHLPRGRSEAMSSTSGPVSEGRSPRTVSTLRSTSSSGRSGSMAGRSRLDDQGVAVSPGIPAPARRSCSRATGCPKRCGGGAASASSPPKATRHRRYRYLSSPTRSTARSISLLLNTLVAAGVWTPPAHGRGPNFGKLPGRHTAALIEEEMALAAPGL